MEVFFHLFKNVQIVLSLTLEDLQLSESKFCFFPAISLLFPAGGRADAGYIKIKAKLSSVELNWGLAELGN